MRSGKSFLLFFASLFIHSSRLRIARFLKAFSKDFQSIKNSANVKDKE